MSTVDGYSLAAVPVETYFETTLLAKATALVWRLGEQYFLITNWHVVSGKNPFTGEHLDKITLAEPNRIRVFWSAKQASIKMRLSEEFSLRGPGGEPHWWIHPEHAQRVDVIAFPIVKNPDAELVPINKIPENDLAIHIGMDVFVIGYPYGPDDTYMPVWKRGSIASEPELVGPQNLFLYIDTASRKGMSGSPVIRRSYGTHVTSYGSVAHAVQCSKFVGVYSGRIVGKDPLDAQLGLMWPAPYIGEICAGGKLDGQG